MGVGDWSDERVMVFRDSTVIANCTETWIPWVCVYPDMGPVLIETRGGYRKDIILGTSGGNNFLLSWETNEELLEGDIIYRYQTTLKQYTAHPNTDDRWRKNSSIDDYQVCNLVELEIPRLQYGLITTRELEVDYGS